jgi:hypothetical protein
VAQRSIDFIVVAILRKTDEQDWYISGDIEDIQVNASSLAHFLAAPTLCSFSRNFGVLQVAQDELRFKELVTQWRKERGITSSPVQMAICPAYQTIIGGMEPNVVVPLILRQLESEGDDPDHWFWALHFLTGADPVSPDDRGDMKKMAAAWLDWGRGNFYAW